MVSSALSVQHASTDTCPLPLSMRSGPAKVGGLPALTALLDAGADVNASDDNGHSALHSAAMDGRLDVVKLLLRE